MGEAVEDLVAKGEEARMRAWLDRMAERRALEIQVSDAPLKDVTLGNPEPEAVVEAGKTVQYPSEGSILMYRGQRFVVSKVLNRHRFIVRWKG